MTLGLTLQLCRFLPGSQGQQGWGAWKKAEGSFAGERPKVLLEDWAGEGKGLGCPGLACSDTQAPLPQHTQPGSGREEAGLSLSPLHDPPRAWMHSVVMAVMGRPKAESHTQLSHLGPNLAVISRSEAVREGGSQGCGWPPRPYPPGLCLQPAWHEEHWPVRKRC